MPQTKIKISAPCKHYFNKNEKNFERFSLIHPNHGILDGTAPRIESSFPALTLMNFSKNTEDIIADFRGLPRTATLSSKRPPVALDNILVLIKEKYKLEQPSAERTLVEHWGEVFGNLAGRCNPVRIKDGRTLIVSVTNQTLRSELQFRKRAVLKTIQALPNCKNVREIVIRG
jgi:hypothetical protein